MKSPPLWSGGRGTGSGLQGWAGPASPPPSDMELNALIEKVADGLGLP